MDGTRAAVRAAQPVSLLVCALGGEGGGVLAEWLVDAAARAGYLAQATSIPGVAQRTGATTYYIEVFPVPEAELGGLQPVFGLSPVAGALDALVSSELLETARQVGLGLVSPDRTRVISARDRALTTVEKMAPTDGRVPAERLVELVRRFARDVRVLDMQELARASGTVVSAVMLGAIAASGLLPIAREVFEAAIRESGRGVLASLRGFAAAYDAVTVTEVPEPAARATAGKTTAPVPAGNGDENRPAAVRPLAALAEARLIDYQGDDYAGLFRRRLARIVKAEDQADPEGRQGGAATRETARFLALWMAFDDIVWVACRKSRAARWERVQREVKAAPGEIVRLYDFFKPGLAEIAALMPARIARRMLAWERRRVARGRQPFAVALKVPAHGFAGLLVLRLLASLRRLRPLSSRYREEQQRIEQWLGRVEQGLRAGWSLGYEIALCGRLVKGYGATLERGRTNLQHILDHVATGSGTAQQRARAVALAREAALADDAGKALDRQLAALGAPPRPVQAQPIRWVRNAPRANAQSRVG
jgi:indolepyruvate ferredoxin oxidoreductase beta subunit